MEKWGELLKVSKSKKRESEDKNYIQRGNERLNERKKDSYKKRKKERKKE